MSRWFLLKTEIQKWIEDQEKDFAEAQNKNPKLSIKIGYKDTSSLTFTRSSLEESIRSYTSGWLG
jgi:hypothetical protein